MVVEVVEAEEETVEVGAMAWVGPAKAEEAAEGRVAVEDKVGAAAEEALVQSRARSRGPAPPLRS